MVEGIIEGIIKGIVKGTVEEIIKVIIEEHNEGIIEGIFGRIQFDQSSKILLTICQNCLVLRVGTHTELYVLTF